MMIEKTTKSFFHFHPSILQQISIEDLPCPVLDARNTKMTRTESCSLNSLESTREDKTHRNKSNATETVIRAIIEVQIKCYRSTKEGRLIQAGRIGEDFRGGDEISSWLIPL